MSRQHQLYAWVRSVTSALPALSKPQATVLALFSFGMMLAQRCSVTAVAAHLGLWLEQPADTVKRRLREWYCEADAKAGRQRRQLQVQNCFADLLRWVLRDWPAPRLALALDATSLGQRFTVLVVSVVYRACAVPVAWRLLPGTKAQAWKPQWLRLLRQVSSRVPADWTVIVLTDRGLYAKWLFRAIQRQGWHPLMRINTRGTFRPDGPSCPRRPLASLVPTLGSRWQGQGVAFKERAQRLRCTLLACWEPGYKDPWLVLTDLPPSAAQVCWYGLRAWIEQGFKRLKSGGWQWHKTRVEEAARAERFWLALAVATWWCLAVGGHAEAGVPVETFAAWPASEEAAAATEPPLRPKKVRGMSIFQRGLIHIVHAILRNRTLPWGQAYDEPWPQHTPQSKPPPRVDAA